MGSSARIILLLIQADPVMFMKTFSIIESNFARVKISGRYQQRSWYLEEHIFVVLVSYYCFFFTLFFQVLFHKFIHRATIGAGYLYNSVFWFLQSKFNNILYYICKGDRLIVDC